MLKYQSSREYVVPLSIGRYGIKVPEFDAFTDRESGLATSKSFRYWMDALVNANDPLPRDGYNRAEPYDKQLVIPEDRYHPLTIIHASYLTDHKAQRVQRANYSYESDWEDLHGLSRGEGRTPDGRVDEFIIVTPPIKLGRSMSTFVLARYEYSSEPSYGGDETLIFQGERIETDAQRAHFAQNGYTEGWHGDDYTTISPAIMKVAEATLELLGV